MLHMLLLARPLFCPLRCSKLCLKCRISPRRRRKQFAHSTTQESVTDGLNVGDVRRIADYLYIMGTGATQRAIACVSS